MFDPIVLAQTLHGHVGLLAAAAIAHPAVSLRAARIRPAMRWSIVLGTALISTTYAAGWLLYPGYRADHKRTLLHESLPQALAFETKEHLAFFVLVLSWTGLVLALFAPEARARRLARIAFAAASVLALAIGVIGSIVGAS